MPDIKIIALDLDNTLLNTRKEISPENAAALERAAAKGIEIVPTTGRFYGAMPECVRALPFLHYAITVNGGQVYDIVHDQVLAKAEIPLALAVDIMRYLDTLPVIYDCYQDNWGYMTATMQDAALDFVPDVHYLKMVRDLRTPVPELKAFLQEQGKDVQKIQFFTGNPALRSQLLEELPLRFPDTNVTSSVPINVEINAPLAHKGAALLALARALGYDMEQTMSFGDGLNDFTMIRDAGIGVAMGNACPEILQAAKLVTATCDENGVAVALEQLGI